MRRDSEKKHDTMSQTKGTNLTNDTATVRRLLDGKKTGVISITPQDSLATAVKLLSENKIGALIVNDDKGNLIGILSERDIVRKLAETPGQTLPQSVEDNMTRDVITCDLEDTLVEILRLMTKGKFRHMPVVENGKVCGMVTIGDVVNYRLTELENEALQLKQMIVG